MAQCLAYLRLILAQLSKKVISLSIMTRCDELPVYLEICPSWTSFPTLLILSQNRFSICLFLCGDPTNIIFLRSVRKVCIIGFDGRKSF